MNNLQKTPRLCRNHLHSSSLNRNWASELSRFDPQWASEPSRCVRVKNIASKEIYEKIIRKACSLGPIQNVYANSRSHCLNLVFFNTKSAERVFNHIEGEAEYTHSKPLPPAEVICGVWRGYSRAFHFVPAARTPPDLGELFKQFGKLMSLRETKVELGSGKRKRAWRVSFCSFADGFRAATESRLKGTILPISVSIPKPALGDFPAYIHSLSSDDGDDSSRTVTISVEEGRNLLSVPSRRRLYELTNDFTVESVQKSGNKLTITFGSPQQKMQFINRLDKFLILLDVGEDGCPSAPLTDHQSLAMTLGANRCITVSGLPRSVTRRMDDSVIKARIQQDMTRYGIVSEVKMAQDRTVYIRFMDIDGAVSALIALNRAQQHAVGGLSDYKDVKEAKFALDDNKRMSASFNDGYIPPAQMLWSDPEEPDSGLDSVDEIADLRYWLAG